MTNGSQLAALDTQENRRKDAIGQVRQTLRNVREHFDIHGRRNADESRIYEQAGQALDVMEECWPFGQHGV